MQRSTLVPGVIGAACALALMAPTTAAVAASISVSDGVLTLRADPGESGQYGASCCPPTTLILWTAPGPTQALAPPLNPGPGCTAITPHQPGTQDVECTGAQAARIELGGGPGGNSVGVPNVPTTVLGGPLQDNVRAGYQPVPLTVAGLEGDDILTGGPGNDTLDGGPGNDQLVTRGGADTVFGGAGNDELGSSKGERGHRFDCGPGQDTMNFDRRAGRAQIDVASCPPVLIWPEAIPVARLAKNGMVRVPVRFTEPARGAIRLFRDRQSFGKAAVRKFVARTTVKIRVNKTAARRVRARGQRGLVVTVAASLVDRSGERSQKGNEDSFAVRLRPAR